MYIKNLTLNGTVTAVTGIKGEYCCINNRSADTVYVAGKAAVTPDGSDVLPVDSCSSALTTVSNGNLWLLGTGKVTLIGSHEPINFIKPSAANSSGGVTKEYVDAAVGSALFAAPGANLLTNPSFSVNQRGLSSYPAGQYTVDCWKSVNVSTEVMSGGVRLTVVNSSTLAEYVQKLEFSYDALAGRKIAVSAVIDGEYVHAEGTVPAAKPSKTSELVYTSGGWRFGLSWSSSGNYYVRFIGGSGSAEISSAKLEIGGTATAFIPPIYSAELLKCQRYLQKYSEGTIGTGYAISGTQAVVFLPLKTNLRGLSGVNVELNGTLSLGTVTHSGSNSLNCTSVTYNKTSTSYCKVVCTAAGLTAGEPVEAQIRTAGDMLLISAEL